MSLPTRQQRVLDQIEKTFQAHDPRIAALFAMFARLTAQEAMPALESLSDQVSRFLRPVVLVPVMVLVLVGTVAGATVLPGPHCPAQRGAQTSRAQASARPAPGCQSNFRTGAAPAIRG
jgi:Protein of unknown function (DUF3040)